VKAPVAAAKAVSKPAGTPSAASSTSATGGIPSTSAKPTTTPATVSKAPAQAPKVSTAAPTAAPGHPANTPSAAALAHVQTSTRDISHPSATLADNPVGYESYYANDATHDAYGNPVQRSNTFGQEKEGVAGTVHDVESQGLTRDIATPHYNQDDAYGGQGDEGYSGENLDEFGAETGVTDSYATDEFGDGQVPEIEGSEDRGINE
jgi:hypothetical protein